MLITTTFSDAYIWYGSHKHAQFAAANGDNVYQYQFNFKGPYGYVMNELNFDLML